MTVIYSISYLRNKAASLQPHERYIILLLDEIHANPKRSYKSGGVVGLASNRPDEEATTVQAFMMCSLLSSNTDMGALVPVKNLNASYLKECTQK
jgi:hypothetical protein